MKQMMEIFDGLPQLSSEQIKHLSEYVNRHYGDEVPIENAKYTGGDNAHIEELVVSRFMHHPTIKIFNDTLISIEGADIFEEEQFNHFLSWAKSKNLNEHIINIPTRITGQEKLSDYPRLIHLNIESLEDNSPEINSNSNPFPWLNELEIHELSQGSINFLGDSKHNITKLRVIHVIGKSPEKILNQFTNLSHLSLASSENFNYTKLDLPQLKSLHTNKAANLNSLIGVPNLHHLSGAIETSEKQYQGPKIKSLTVAHNTRNPVILSNIVTSELESIRSWGGTAIHFDTDLPSLESLLVHSSHTNEEFKLSWLKFAPNLRDLHLSNRKVSIDIDKNWRHPSLTLLNASGSRLENIGFLVSFPNLERIHLPNNNINSLEPLITLKKLRYADLSDNNIIDIPPEFSDNFEFSTKYRNYKSDEKYIIINNNPLISPPIEIAERGQKAVKPYFDSMLGNIEELNEAKIVFLGNGEVGKTSLMKALIGEKFNDKEKTTHGINIKKYSVPINERYSVDASIWDFGGQQIMHATHQLFLSRRCVYVLVINDRKDDLQQDQKIEYWLQQVQTYGGDSKVIIVRNKIDEFDVNNLQEGKLKEKFPNLLKVEGVSCADGTGIDKVRKLINAQVAQLPMRKVKLASNWIQVKNEIKALSYERDHLPLSAFTEICCKNGIHDKEAQTTLRHLLHDLSVIIAFEELADFDMGILNPHWITDGIYAIINSTLLATNNGYIKLPEVQQELDNTYPDKYNGKARFIIESMMQFELCHPVGSAQSKTYLVPNLLPTEVKNKALNYGKNTINFIFKYENLLPPALFPKLLVRLSSNISADRRWRTGAVLSDSNLNVQALIEEDSVDRIIKIVVTGNQARDFFAYIRQNVRSLNGVNSERLGVQEHIPLPDSDGHTVSYDELIGHELDERSEYYNGIIRKSFSVSQLLSGIESREETAKAVDEHKRDMTVNVHVKTGDNHITNTNNNTNTQDQTQTATQSLNIDIKVELKGLKGSAENLLEDLRDDAEGDISDPTERKRFIKECDKVERALSVVEDIESKEEASQNLGSFARIKDFLENSLDKTGNIGQTMELLGNNIGKIREIAKKYNKVAGFFGLPIVPEVLL
ncbi:50S ribosome-binding GTPase [Vibrio parahaemolyticus]|nr:50S ribosome-binding GTPase [Vibrio parahaemolyticus]EJG1766260.1 50S ribosome-binding GTPase [Vibrio parahaemolyticus]ELA7364759.1 50S ribosome-binding GTPase [Vibrio parahaemolyticus]HCE5171367.1 50S ribosome-binding GTPase [Vibrio parahaemolyticus]HCE5272052.1 50S ribosome-binding GTPase [Vibrio parahaemolyticus]